MSTFKKWFEQEDNSDGMHVSPQEDRKIRDIWDGIFERLAGKQSKADSVSKTLKDLTYSRNRSKSSSQEILDTIGPLMQQLSGVHPEYKQKVEDVMSWLGERQEGGSPDRTLKDLMSRLFGDKYEKFLSGERDSSDMGDDSLKKAPSVPPLDSVGSQVDSPPQPDMPDGGMAPMLPQQPQVPDPSQMAPPVDNQQDLQQMQPQLRPNAAKMRMY